MSTDVMGKNKKNSTDESIGNILDQATNLFHSAAGEKILFSILDSFFRLIFNIVFILFLPCSVGGPGSDSPW
jgi:hypothetical protein